MRPFYILLFKFSLLAIIVIAMLQFLDTRFKQENSFKSTFRDYEKLEDITDLDILIYGSSHAYCSFNPNILNIKTKLLSFNLGGPAQRLTTTKHLLLESLKKSNPRLVVIDIYSLTVSTDFKNIQAKNYQLQTYDYTSFSMQKLQDIYANFGSSEFIYASSPFLRNHQEYSDVDLFSYKDRYLYKEMNNRQFFNGFLNSNVGLNKKDKLKYEPILSTLDVSSFKENVNDNPTVLGEDSIKIIDEIIEIVKNHNAELLFTMAPTLRYFEKGEFYNKQNSLIKYLNQKGVKFINFHDHFETLKFKISDFSDPGHLNAIGSEKSSAYLANYINKNYDFPKRDKDDAYLLELRKNLNYQLNHNLEHAFATYDKGYDLLSDLKVKQTFIIKENENQILVLFELNKEQTPQKIVSFKMEYDIKTSAAIFNEQIPERLIHKEKKSFTPKMISRNNKFYIYNRLQIKNNILLDIDFQMINKINNKRSEIYSLSKMPNHKKLKLNENR